MEIVNVGIYLGGVGSRFVLARFHAKANQANNTLAHF